MIVGVLDNGFAGKMCILQSVLINIHGKQNPFLCLFSTKWSYKVYIWVNWVMKGVIVCLPSVHTGCRVVLVG